MCRPFLVSDDAGPFPTLAQTGQAEHLRSETAVRPWSSGCGHTGRRYSEGGEDLVLPAFAVMVSDGFYRPVAVDKIGRAHV